MKKEWEIRGVGDKGLVGDINLRNFIDREGRSYKEKLKIYRRQNLEYRQIVLVLESMR